LKDEHASVFVRVFFSVFIQSGARKTGLPSHRPMWA